MNTKASLEHTFWSKQIIVNASAMGLREPLLERIGTQFDVLIRLNPFFIILDNFIKRDTRKRRR